MQTESSLRETPSRDFITGISSLYSDQQTKTWFLWALTEVECGRDEDDHGDSGLVVTGGVDEGDDRENTQSDDRGPGQAARTARRPHRRLLGRRGTLKGQNIKL